MADSLLIHPNKYIIGNDEAWKLNTIVTPDTCCSSQSSTTTPYDKKSKEEFKVVGRECKYLATIVYTPILTSSRLSEEFKMTSDKNKSNANSTKKQPKSQRLIVDKEDIQELSHKLERLFLKEDNTNKNVEKDDADEDTDSTTTEVSGIELNKQGILAKCEPEPLMGRFFKWAFSYKTNKVSQVMRSARLAVQEK